MRFLPKERFQLMVSALALCEDRGPMHIDELAAELGCDAGRITEALRPLSDLELLEDGRPLLDITHDVTITDGVVEVHTNWLRDIAGISPSGAARLYVQIVTARSLDPKATIDLARLRRRLEAAAGPVLVNESIPPIVERLRRSATRHRIVALTIQGDATEPFGPVKVEVHRVVRSGANWDAIVRLVDGVPGIVDPGVIRRIDALTVVDLVSTHDEFDSIDVDGPIVPLIVPLVAIIEHQPAVSWLLEQGSLLQREVVDEHIVRSTVEVSGLGRLGVLLLRLGDRARLIEPVALSRLGRDLATDILRQYRDRPLIS